jgi:hypothetical protein
MTHRERILAVYQGRQPDQVPFMLDLSHWHYHQRRQPWDLSVSYEAPEYDLIARHRDLDVGFYLPNLGSFYSVVYPEHVKVTTTKKLVDGVPEISWRIETSSGCIERVRVWQEQTYSWPIKKWGFSDEAGLRIFQEAMCRREYVPHWDRFRRWDECVGDTGVVYLPFGYSAMGHLLNYWMGIESVIYATLDFPELLSETVEMVNADLLKLIDLLCSSPAQVVLMGDNISGDVQPPAFFKRWSHYFYAEAVRRLHAVGKYVAVHIDGRLRGALEMVRDTGADCADAVTPTPMGDLSPGECRANAGDRFILSGGVSPDLWLPGVPLDAFEAKVIEWLSQKQLTFRFIANAGDQVPPGAEERRIHLMRDLVSQHGRLNTAG